MAQLIILKDLLNDLKLNKHLTRQELGPESNSERYNLHLLDVKPGDTIRYDYLAHAKAIEEEEYEKNFLRKFANVPSPFLCSYLYHSDTTYLDVYEFFKDYDTFSVYFSKLYPNGDDPYLIVTLGPYQDGANTKRLVNGLENAHGWPLEDVSRHATPKSLTPPQKRAQLKNYDTKKYNSAFVNRIGSANSFGDGFCFICGASGDLVNCGEIRCGRAYHLGCLQELFNAQAKLNNQPVVAVTMLEKLRCPLHELQKGYYEYLIFDPVVSKMEQEQQLQRTCLNYIMLKTVDEICSYNEAQSFFRLHPNQQYYKVIPRPLFLMHLRMKCLGNLYNNEAEIIADFDIIKENSQLWCSHSGETWFPQFMTVYNKFHEYLRRKVVELKCKKKTRRNAIIQGHKNNGEKLPSHVFLEEPEEKLAHNGNASDPDYIEDLNATVDYSEVNSSNVIATTSRRRTNRTRYNFTDNNDESRSDDEDKNCGNCANCQLHQMYSKRMLFKSPTILCQRQKNGIPLKMKFNSREKFEAMSAAFMHVGSGGKQLENVLVDLTRVWNDFHFEITSEDKDIFNMVIPLSCRFAQFLYTTARH